MSQQTKTIDKLFLELSQFTKARTQRELKLEDAVERAFLAGLNIGNNPQFQMTQSMDQWTKYKKLMLKDLLD
ncbi:MAG: hypothetical protein JAY71_18770 [Candidatus Thiodiazotropha weberae]|nr:hypothetical protein [Candidatus Thiodiazotropha weberae]